MEVTIKLYGALRRYRPEADGPEHRPFTLELEPETTVDAALRQIEIPTEMVSAVAVNGEQAEIETVLHGGDTVHIFPPSAGG